MGKLGSNISKKTLSFFGWKITGRYASEIDKKVLIVVPHTSSWDFPLGLLVRSAIQGKIQFVGKDSLFKPPFGWIFKALGGVPVDRSRSTNFVQNVIDVFDSREKFNIVLAPEGTRKMVDQLKSGFYYIAKGANVPIQMIRFNFGKKEVEFREPFYPTDDFEADMKLIEDYYRGIKGIKEEYSFGWKPEKKE